jgi:hypothetical protein
MLGLPMLRAINIETCLLRKDLKVVVGLIEKECIARKAALERYLALVQRMESYFNGFTVEYIERNKNTEANDLAEVISRNMPMLVDIFFQVIEECSVKTVMPEPILIDIIEGEDWCALIMAYLRHYYELNSANEQIRMQQ